MCFLILYASLSRFEAAFPVTNVDMRSFPYLPLLVDQWFSSWLGTRSRWCSSSLLLRYFCFLSWAILLRIIVHSDHPIQQYIYQSINQPALVSRLAP